MFLYSFTYTYMYLHKHIPICKYIHLHIGIYIQIHMYIYTSSFEVLFPKKPPLHKISSSHQIFPPGAVEPRRRFDAR